MKIYRTRTQEDYNSLMVELEKQGFKWTSGNKNPTSKNNWHINEEETCVRIVDSLILYADCEYYEERFPDIPIIEYKANKQGETNDFIKELTVKIYYNEITKKHYNSYEEAITDCKKEMDKLYDKN